MTTPEITIIKNKNAILRKKILHIIYICILTLRLIALILRGFIHNSISVFLVCGSFVAKAEISHAVRGLCYR